MSGLQLFVRFKYLSNGVFIMINNIKTLSSLNEGSSGRVAELKNKRFYEETFAGYRFN